MMPNFLTLPLRACCESTFTLCVSYASFPRVFYLPVLLLTLAYSLPTFLQVLMTTHLYPILYRSFSEFQWANGGESHVTCNSVELAGIASRLRGGEAGAAMKWG